MTRIKILFICFLFFLTSGAKSLKESTIDNENTSKIIKITLFGLQNNEESINEKNGNILSTSELNKLYNTEDLHLTDLQLIKKAGSDHDEEVESKNNNTNLEISELEQYNEESKTDRNIGATTFDSREGSKERMLEKSITETIESESTTVSNIGQSKTGELIKGFEDDLEVTVTADSTEASFKTVVSDDEPSSDRPDDTVATIPLRRSIFQNDKLLLDYTEKTNKNPDEIVKVDEDIVSTSEKLGLEKPNEESDVDEESKASKSEELSSETYDIEITTINSEGKGKTGEVEEKDDLEIPEIGYSTEGYFGDDVSNDEPITDFLDNFATLPTRRSILQNDKLLLNYRRKISKKPVEFEELEQKIVPGTETISPRDTDELSNVESYRAKSGEIWTNDKSIEEFDLNIYDNAYPYAPSKVRSVSQQSLTKEPDYNLLYSKLSEASKHPLRGRLASGVSLGNAKNVYAVPQIINPYSDTILQQYHNLPQQLSFRRTIPEDIRITSNEEIRNIRQLRMARQDFKQNTNLGKSGENWTKEKDIEKLTSNIFDNAYPYTPSKVERQSRQQTNEPNYNPYYSKLSHASEHPFRKRAAIGVGLVNYGAILSNTILRNRLLQNFAPHYRHR